MTVAAPDDQAAVLASLGGRLVHVVSPHLDDAVLSAFGLLTHAHARRLNVEVTTLFTEPDDPGPGDWATVTGFADGFQEFAARREEDRRVFRSLGLSARHCGQRAADWSDPAADAVVRELLAAGGAQEPWILLPAGAGRHLNAWQRAYRRVARVPFGAPPHPEHESARDRLWRALERSGAQRVGFYAELPYLWSDRPAALAGRLEALTGRSWSMRSCTVDGRAKREAFAGYRSQFEPILGRKLTYQLRVLSRQELYFFPPELR